MIPLEEVFAHYGNPDPSIVSTLDKNGVSLSYVGHGEITKALSEIDPQWTWEPVLGADGMPAIRIQNGKIPRRDKDPILVDMATMWGRLTLNGVTRWAVGSVEAHKPDLDKELVSDFLRNAAMRFGVALGLWIKDSTPTGNTWNTNQTPRVTTQRSENVTQTGPANGATDKQIGFAKSFYKNADKLPPVWLQTLTKHQIAGVIDELKEGRFPENPAANEYPTDEEPF